jgi:hypothetical protein
VNLIYANQASISGYSLHVSDCYATTDALGQPVTKVDVSAEVTAIRTAGTYFVSWEHGGATPMDSVVDTDAAGAVLLWWLRQSSVDIDFPRSASGFAYLDAYTLSGFTDAPLSPLDWAADRLADYPVKFVNGPAGKIVVPVRFMAQASEAIAAITVDDPVVSSVSGGTTGAVRVGPMKCSGKNQVTEVRVNWAKGLGSGTFYQQTVFSTDPNRSSKVSRNPSRVGALSKSSAVKAIEVSLTDCWSSATAFNVAQYVAWRDGAPKRTVTVAVPTATHGHLIEGDVVLYTDVPLGLVDVVALVDEVPLTASTMTELTLLLLR